MKEEIVSDGKYTIKKHSDLDVYFLDNEQRCIGGIDRRLTDGWYVATIHAPYDRETETDVDVVYQGESLSRAIGELWESRFNAI